jgi:hypothetical protein
MMNIFKSYLIKALNNQFIIKGLYSIKYLGYYLEILYN